MTSHSLASYIEIKNIILWTLTIHIWLTSYLKSWVYNTFYLWCRPLRSDTPRTSIVWGQTLTGRDRLLSVSATEPSSSETWTHELREWKNLNRGKTNPTQRQTGRERILSSVVAFCILQPLHHVRERRGGGRALRHSQQVQTVCVLLVELEDYRHLVTDGVSDGLQRRPEGKRESGWMTT